MDFALEALGIDVVMSNDISEEATQTLKKYFSHSDVKKGDIREIQKFPSADLLVGGYPCQSFSLGGRRAPSNDPRSYLYLEYARALAAIQPKFFVAENVSGMAGVEDGVWFKEQLRLFSGIGKGYLISHQLVNVQNYGVPQKRKRIIIVGVRKDIGAKFEFPAHSHGAEKQILRNKKLKPYASHGEAIKHLPLHPSGEYYERPHDPTGHMSWYYMSRNRKANWFEPSFCIVANFRHITLHPACQTMKLVWSNLKDGFKQKWEFSGEYEHTKIDPTLPVLEIPRRLSWREAAAIQTFPRKYEPVGDLERKFEQIGNAVPPLLFKKLIAGIKSGDALRSIDQLSAEEFVNQSDLFSI